MKMIYAAIAAFVLALPAAAQSSAYDSLTVSTTTGRARRSTSGFVTVSAGSTTPSAYTIILNGTNGGVNASSATLVYGVRASTGVFTNTASAYSVTTSSGVNLLAGELKINAGGAGVVFPDGSRQTSAGTSLAVILASTNPWSGGNSFTGSTTFYTNVFGITTSSETPITFTNAPATIGACVAGSTITFTSLTGFVDVCAKVEMTGGGTTREGWGFLLNGAFAAGYSSAIGVVSTFESSAGGVDGTSISGCKYRLAVPAGSNTYCFSPFSAGSASDSSTSSLHQFVIKQTQ